jgi:broad specificity phosphatase PhoE
MVPKRLLLVRHGESEGNVSQDDPALAEKTKGTPNNELRLTPNGVQQAQAAGRWLRDYLGTLGSGRPAAGYVSTFVRALETAGHLGLGLEWQHHAFIVERDWGSFEELTAEQQAKYKAAKKRSPLYATMPNGQNLATLLMSNHLFLGMLHREHTDDTVVAVCHGERILTLRYMLERMTDRAFLELANSKHTGDKVRNCQVIEYTRLDPESGHQRERFEWMRSICPWDIRDKDLQWKPILRQKMSDKDLLAYAGSFPSLL